ncbi:hypothetical protein A5784_34960 [Mycobacterium sp. 852013-50091_SCH5140682]|uniref:hypothetical protein n=1 Tax=Mycobacterium sp. 852013-50091_SCH5140682 TaxID=1834109 RepID=UPI0007EBB32D|nr:hypothetical protein [Mycobacterium sp. 852013-50091_SCH5140682]OBC11401.1 hypothetical protein A5784_34960 [Mycobacterium sp. 852013-50091_SCH5140682]
MIGTTLTFLERYDELHGLDLPDWQVAKRMGITLSSLERQLERYHRPVSELLRDLAREERERHRAAS